MAYINTGIMLSNILTYLAALLQYKVMAAAHYRAFIQRGLVEANALVVWV